MAVGNVLVRSLDIKKLHAEIDDMALMEKAFARLKDKYYYYFGYTDCSLMIKCSSCAKDYCAGCVHEFLIDLDTDNATCANCLRDNIFIMLANAQKKG